jgi:hypothetical protein
VFALVDPLKVLGRLRLVLSKRAGPLDGTRPGTSTARPVWSRARAGPARVQCRAWASMPAHSEGTGPAQQRGWPSNSSITNSRASRPPSPTPPSKPKPNPFPSRPLLSISALTSLPRCRLSLVRGPLPSGRLPPIRGIRRSPASLCLSLVDGSDDLVTGALGSQPPPLPRSLPSARRLRLQSEAYTGEPMRCAGRQRICRSGDWCSNPPLLSLCDPLCNPNPRSSRSGLRVSSPLVASSVDLVLRRVGMNL